MNSGSQFTKCFQFISLKLPGISVRYGFTSEVIVAVYFYEQMYYPIIPK